MHRTICTATCIAGDCILNGKTIGFLVLIVFFSFVCIFNIPIELSGMYFVCVPSLFQHYQFSRSNRNAFKIQTMDCAIIYGWCLSHSLYSSLCSFFLFAAQRFSSLTRSNMIVSQPQSISSHFCLLLLFIRLPLCTCRCKGLCACKMCSLYLTLILFPFSTLHLRHEWTHSAESNDTQTQSNCICCMCEAVWCCGLRWQIDCLRMIIQLVEQNLFCSCMDCTKIIFYFYLNQCRCYFHQVLPHFVTFW